MSILQVNHLRKSFGELDVLKDVNLSLEQGQSLSIIGPSGSGKSTLVRLINTLDKVDSGEIYLLDDYICKLENGKTVYNAPERLSALRKRYGMVFQSFNLFPHMNVQDNVSFALKLIQKLPKGQAEEKAQAYLEQVGLAAKAKSYPHELSGGQQQRVAIARALALKPEILFFDEPTSALDPELTREVLCVILDLVKQNMTMVIVTHEMTLACATDRVVMMEGGVIVHESRGCELEGTDNERVKKFIDR